jgi:RNA recognition motif-containing protein
MNRFQSRFNPMGGNLGAPISQQPNIRQASEVGGFTLYVYNVGYHPNEQNLAALFSQYGVVNKVDIIWDWQKNQSKGFAFVSMATKEAAQSAIDNLNGYMLYSRPLQVSFYSGRNIRQ